MRKKLLATSLLLAGLLLPNVSCNFPGSTAPTKEKTFFAVYMVGSDLEDDIKPRNEINDEEDKGGISTVGAGSSDLREMISAVQDFTGDQGKYIDSYVAFGGARKKGWKGVKYADMPCLTKDNEDDDYFGNSDCYFKKDDNANMGEEKTLTEFLKWSKEKSEGYGKKIIVFWDHGAAYSGVGYDTNFKDKLELEELNKSFTTTGFKADLVAFDACLMGNLEVIQTMKPFASYMLGSEELVPGHGWQYAEAFSYITKNPQASIVDIGKKVIDIFVDSPKHVKGKNKTLALIDLKKADPVINGINSISLGFNTKAFEPVLTSVKSSEKYGESSQEDSYSMDLKNFAENLKTKDPNYLSQVDKLKKAIDEMVIYEKHDATKPNASGVSIFSMSNSSVDTYKKIKPLTKEWNGFVNEFVNLGLDDSQAPEVLNESDCVLNTIPGHCVKANDNVGLASVNVEYSIRQKDGNLQVIGNDQVSTIDKKDTYYFAEWDGEWIKLCNGECDGKNEEMPPLYFLGVTKDKGSVYIADCLHNGKPANINIELNKNADISKVWVTPYEVLASGEKLMSRNQVELLKGDTVQFKFQIADVKANTQKEQLGKVFTLTSDPVWKFGYVEADELSYIAITKDYKGNIKYSKEHNLVAN